ncbi:10128_t:CDS:2 [Diversispora eburnea]|uniref:10128_t:CDS:1 n=1 Tax=Diversispora eburnea TaxID=1213867 RepID=A0A9N9FEU0_9GLOM|nr:10128_t:CDS:2 [Diversispora eburnea]
MESKNMKPIIITENVLLEVYIKYLKAEQKLPVNIYLINRKIIAHEVPLLNYAIIAGNAYPISIVKVDNSKTVSSLYDLLTSYFSSQRTIQSILQSKYFLN